MSLRLSFRCGAFTIFNLAVFRLAVKFFMGLEADMLFSGIYIQYLTEHFLLARCSVFVRFFLCFRYNIGI